MRVWAPQSSTSKCFFACSARVWIDCHMLNKPELKSINNEVSVAHRVLVQGPELALVVIGELAKHIDGHHKLREHTLGISRRWSLKLAFTNNSIRASVLYR